MHPFAPNEVYGGKAYTVQLPCAMWPSTISIISRMPPYKTRILQLHTCSFMRADGEYSLP